MGELPLWAGGTGYTPLGTGPVWKSVPILAIGTWTPSLITPASFPLDGWRVGGHRVSLLFVSVMIEERTSPCSSSSKPFVSLVLMLA